MFKIGDEVHIQLETKQSPFGVTGIIQDIHKEWLTVEGTVGDNIGNLITVPVRKVKLIKATRIP